MGEVLIALCFPPIVILERIEGMCTLDKRGNIFLLTLTGIHDEHLFHLDLIDSLTDALQCIRSEATKASALITTAQGKFFSNGFPNWGLVDRARQRLIMSKKFRSLISDLISLPMPTIAAVTGHASGTGFAFTLCHDYILMRKDRGYLYMSELHVGAKIPVWSSTLVRCRLGQPMVQREVFLKGEKLTADVAAQMGIVDSSHTGADETEEAAVKLGEELVSRNWDGNVYDHETLGDYDAIKTMSKM